MSVRVYACRLIGCALERASQHAEGVRVGGTTGVCVSVRACVCEFVRACVCEFVRA